MLQNDKGVNHSLNIALRNLAQSYNYEAGNWRSSSYQLDNVARIIKAGEWSSQIKAEVTHSIQRRINRRYPTTSVLQNSGHCTQHIAENAVKRIEYRLRHDKSSILQHFIDINNYL